MHILKLALPLAGLFVGGQALAHKASHGVATVAAPIRPAASRIDTDPTILLDEVGGRGVQGTGAQPGMALVPAAVKTNSISIRINRRH